MLLNFQMHEYYTGPARTTTTTKSPLNQFLATYRLAQGRPQTSYVPAITSPPESGEVTDAPPAIDLLRQRHNTAREQTVPVTHHALRERDDSDGGWSIDLTL